jgi:hypothetical protein
MPKDNSRRPDFSSNLMTFIQALKGRVHYTWRAVSRERILSDRVGGEGTMHVEEKDQGGRARLHA